MTIPHNFPSLVKGPAQVVLIVGTGLSTPNAPTVSNLNDKLSVVGHKLGVTVTVTKNHDDYFYILAEAVLDQKINDEQMTDSESRLWLAEELGMLKDRRWFGEVNLPLSGNTPRHRAIARFAVEKRIKAIISLNWDTLLEAALDSVGLSENVETSRPWDITTYARVVHDQHLPLISNDSVFPVLKPHGCVRDLEHASRNNKSGNNKHPVILKLKKSELEQLPGGQTELDTRVNAELSNHPLIAVGWKASEGYLRKTLTKAAKCVQLGGSDCFTVVNRSWYHDEIANAYNTSELLAHVAVGKANQPTVDCIFLWLQARYALTKLIAKESSLLKVKLEQLLSQIEQPNCGTPYHFIYGWADKWLPTWVRLCWRAGRVRGCENRTNRRIEPWEIPITPRDVHIPLAGAMTGERDDLKAATNLLVTMGNNLEKYEFDKFPGGLWQAEEQCLYLPLPTWGESSKHYDLAALKPQLQDMRDWAFVKKIKLIRLGLGDNKTNQTICQQLEAQVRNLMPITSFACGDALSWIDLDLLKGDINEPLV